MKTKEEIKLEIACLKRIKSESYESIEKRIKTLEWVLEKKEQL